jgi:hypothetical protein
MSLRNEDRELQNKIAELQANVQINLTYCFGLLTMLVVAIAGFGQVYFSLPPENNLLRVYLTMIILLLSFIGGSIFAVAFYLKKAIDSRTKMEELRKQFV